MTPNLEALPELLAGLGIEINPINEHHALAAVEPEPPTRDPFDRLLLAQCQIENLRLVTVDRALAMHPMAAETKYGAGRGSRLAALFFRGAVEGARVTAAASTALRALRETAFGEGRGVEAPRRIEFRSSNCASRG